jgi:acetate kinase
VRVLCFDAGSSSLKTAAYEVSDTLCRAAEGEGRPDAIGHRIVFGGHERDAPVRIDEHVLRDLERLREWDPLHLDREIGIVRETMRRFPGVAQVACFDTAFFHSLPEVARRLPLPRSLPSYLRRYGFHGLSYEWALSSLDDPWGRIVVAHLGSGASLCAIRDGAPVETTMSFSPLGGLMMATRPGDLDPGILLDLLRHHYSSSQLSSMLYGESGLKGVSGLTGDMRALLDAEASNSQAAEAVELFVHQLRKHLGAMIASLGGLDMLVFTGGIGEHAPTIRSRACEPFRYLGLSLDEEANLRGAQVISKEESRVNVRVVIANENAMIARHVWRTLNT